VADAAGMVGLPERAVVECDRSRSALRAVRTSRTAPTLRGVASEQPHGPRSVTPSHKIETEQKACLSLQLSPLSREESRSPNARAPVSVSLDLRGSGGAGGSMHERSGPSHLLENLRQRGNVIWLGHIPPAVGQVIRADMTTPGGDD
jgi:hypothetical protein